jgi:hypothetical protein
VPARSTFEQLRDHAPGFSGLMASQSGIDTWHIRVAGGAPEEASGRLVSGGFFAVLGVRPAIFQSGLESFNGAGRRDERGDQRLVLQPGSRGASAARVDPMTALHQA